MSLREIDNYVFKLRKIVQYHLYSTFELSKIFDLSKVFDSRFITMLKIKLNDTNVQGCKIGQLVTQQDHQSVEKLPEVVNS